MKHFRTPTLAILAGACLSLLGTNALAESTYGYSPSGTGTITASARLNLVINVPKLILLRVGGDGTAITDLIWNAGPTWTTQPGTLPTTDVSNQANSWDGTAPIAPTLPAQAVVAAHAWTNSSGGGSLAYAATAFGAGGPTLGNITVTPGAGLAHPTPVALATASTGPATFTKNALATGTWSFALGGTPTAWTAGQYTSQITYTATSL